MAARRLPAVGLRRAAELERKEEAAGGGNNTRSQSTGPPLQPDRTTILRGYDDIAPVQKAQSDQQQPERYERQHRTRITRIERYESSSASGSSADGVSPRSDFYYSSASPRSVNNNNNNNNNGGGYFAKDYTPLAYAPKIGAPVDVVEQYDEPEEPVIAVSGRHRCAHCQKELGRGAAMVVESLRLFYHLACFRCYVCGTPLGSGRRGADVRVRDAHLHCAACYSQQHPTEGDVRFSQV